jgi:hypothetical protein
MRQLHSRTILAIFFLLPLISHRASDDIFIRFQYLGDEHKPYPLLYFTVAGDEYISEQPFAFNVEITCKQFRSIKKLIKLNNKEYPDSIFLPGYSFAVINKKDTIVTTCKNIQALRTIFNAVEVHVPQNKKENVTYLLKSTISRIISENLSD